MRPRQLSSREALRRQHKALSTEDAYVFWLRRYLKALSAIDPGLSSDKKVESFLTQLARGGVSASSQNQAFNALLYHAGSEIMPS